jgi:hypothetical protein
VEITVRTEATFGKSTLGKKSESAARWNQKIESAQNNGDLSERIVATENLFVFEQACSLKFAR